MVITNKKSINNLNKSTSSIGIPSIFFKNKSILNFNQLTSVPKADNSHRSESIWDKLKPSIYGEKLSNRVKRSIIPDQSYLHEQKIQACKILESKKRRLSETQQVDHGNKKLCVNNPDSNDYSGQGNTANLFQSSVNLNSKAPQKRPNVSSPINHKLSRTIDKEYTLRDESFLLNPYLFEQIKTPKTINAPKKTNTESITQTREVQLDNIDSFAQPTHIEEKVIHLKEITSNKSPIVQYKTKSISQLLSEIDNHRLMTNKNKKISCRNLTQRFENIKNLLNNAVPISEGKGMIRYGIPC